MDASVIAILIGLVSAAPGVGALIVQYSRDRRNIPADRADLAEKYKKLAEHATDKLSEMQEHIDGFETKVSNLERELRRSNEQTARFEDWARRLVFQVRSLGAVPVDLDPTQPAARE